MSEVYGLTKIKDIADRLRDPNAVAANVPGAIVTLALLVEESCIYVESSEAKIIELVTNAGGMIAEASETAKKARAGVKMLKQMLDGGAVPPAQDVAATEVPYTVTTSPVGGVPTPPAAPAVVEGPAVLTDEELAALGGTTGELREVVVEVPAPVAVQAKAGKGRGK